MRLFSLCEKYIVALIKVSGREEHLAERYEEEALPIQARYYRGSPNYKENQDWRRVFNTEDIVKARIAVMIGQIYFTEADKYLSLFPTELDGLKISKEKKQKLQQMFDNN